MEAAVLLGTLSAFNEKARAKRITERNRARRERDGDGLLRPAGSDWVKQLAVMFPQNVRRAGQGDPIQ